MAVKTAKPVRAKAKARAKSPNGKNARKAVKFVPTKLKLLTPVPSDIEIAQAAHMRPIVELARERLGYAKPGEIVVKGSAPAATLPVGASTSSDEDMMNSCAGLL